MHASEGYFYGCRHLSTERHNSVSIVGLRTDDLGFRRHLRRTCTVGDSQIGSLHTDLIPQMLLQERIERLGTTFNNQRLDMMGMQTLQIQWMSMIDDKPLGSGTSPIADIQLWTITLFRYTPHQDRIFLCAQLMR